MSYKNHLGSKGHNKGVKHERGNGATYRDKLGRKRCTRLYRIWLNLRVRGGVVAREAMSRHKDRYGYAHVTVCEEWAHSFTAFKFWAILSGYRDDLTIDRIDVRLGYSPENCRWATRAEQSREHRRPWGSVMRHGKPVKAGTSGVRPRR